MSDKMYTSMHVEYIVLCFVQMKILGVFTIEIHAEYDKTMTKTTCFWPSFVSSGVKISMFSPLLLIYIIFLTIQFNSKVLVKLKVRFSKTNQIN